ncbi:MAG: hypothetical protein ABJB05_03510 [Parafilimonas sp.]
MKKFIIILWCSLFFGSCLHRESNEPYLENDFKQYTGIDSGYKINKTILKANQACLYITLIEAEEIKLKNRFTFLDWDDFLLKKYHSGRIPFELYDFDKRNYNYVYYIADGNAPFEYFIICLSKQKNEIIYCENFRESPLTLF